MALLGRHCSPCQALGVWSVPAWLFPWGCCPVRSWRNTSPALGASCSIFCFSSLSNVWPQALLHASQTLFSNTNFLTLFFPWHSLPHNVTASQTLINLSSQHACSRGEAPLASLPALLKHSVTNANCYLPRAGPRQAHSRGRRSEKETSVNFAQACMYLRAALNPLGSTGLAKSCPT